MRGQLCANGRSESLQKILDSILKECAASDLTSQDLDKETELLIKSRLSGVLLEKLKARALDRLETSVDVEKAFEDIVLGTWSKPLGLLDLLLNICLEVAGEFSSIYEGRSSSKHSFVQKALARQQANGCLVFNEILHLLKSGFPSGAHSRWRSLHEITCVSYFISKHGEDLAKRFLDYEAVEAYFQAEATYEHQQKMECSSLSQSALKALKSKFKIMEKTYGSDFVKKTSFPYGWVPTTLLKTRSLREIEKSVKLHTFRPYYDLASFKMHGRQNALEFRLKINKNRNKRVAFPVGPSNYGLAEPGKAAAISLGQITACLLLSEPDDKKLLIVEALRNLVDEICDAFTEIHMEFSQD
jgi:hypothetical protein